MKKKFNGKCSKLRLLGMIGGMAYPSTMIYYTKINEKINSNKGEWNSAQILLYSVEFQEIINSITQNQWSKISEIMLEKAKLLERAGCDAIMICSNTMHQIAPELEKALAIPILNIIDAVGNSINQMNLKTVLLLGTKSTMEKDFYRTRLKTKFGIRSLIPKEEDRFFINQVIYSELAHNIINHDSQTKIFKIIEEMSEYGAQGIILGCGEIPMIINPKNTNLPLFDSMDLHIQAAVEFLLES